MENAGSPFETRKDPNDLLKLQDKNRFQRLFQAQAVKSYLFLSFGMGLVATLMPIALVAAGGYVGNYSISYFYHVGDLSRNILVGCLWATGVFLFLFHGLSKTENWLLNLAGLAAVSVAMNPMPAQQCVPNRGLTAHSASAILFFGLIAYVAVRLSKGRIRFITSERKKRLFTSAYNVTAAAMLVMPAAVFAIHVLSRGVCESHWIFWIECLGIWAFAAYWFVKTIEYKLLLRIR